MYAHNNTNPEHDRRLANVFDSELLIRKHAGEPVQPRLPLTLDAMTVRRFGVTVQRRDSYASTALSCDTLTQLGKARKINETLIEQA